MTAARTGVALEGPAAKTIDQRLERFSQMRTALQTGIQEACHTAQGGERSSPSRILGLEPT